MNNKSGYRVGILGGGQLARMSAFAAIRMGIEVSILEKKLNSPAGMLTKHEFVGWVEDKFLLNKFANSADVITLENEFIDSHILSSIENAGKKVIPSSKSISLIQDKFIQKKTLLKNKIPVPDFIKIETDTPYQFLSERLGKKFVLKSRKMGYDGYGNALVKNEQDFNKSKTYLAGRHSELYAEEYIPFIKELAVMVVRSKNKISTYPVVETIQKNHICHTVIAPAQISEKIINEAEKTAVNSVKAISGYGIFGIEMFLTRNNKILVNEMAPRPHNSGHYTIEACITSQFENHIRSVLNLPLGSTRMIKPFAVMINLLGKKNGPGVLKNYKDSLSDDSIHLHLYGKKESRIGRKMGHITIIGNNLSSILRRAQIAEKKIIL